ncbi:hypothetical protein [Kordiimonas sp.]|uniref:hypothetical protein n=1 Tax=Kordiimonas sp. TaxID=1970157 RepID=UPI003A8E1486
MNPKFPIVEFIKQSFTQTFAYPLGLAITIGFLVGVVVLAGVVISLAGMVLSDLLPQMLTLALASVAILLVVVLVLGWGFNFWVRYGAEGRDNVLPAGFKGSITPALETGLKLFFITILLAIVASVMFLIAGIFGFGVSLKELATLSEMSTAEMIRKVGVLYLFTFGVTCAVYSGFSSNLTKTAMGRANEEIGEPHIGEFAVVLFSIYLIFYVPLTLIQLATPAIIGEIFEILVGLLLLAVVPVAHGLRYDWQRQVYAARQDGDMSGA